jgi:hypothetical protein
MPDARCSLRLYRSYRGSNLHSTLTSSILKFVHTLIFPITFYTLCSLATPGYFKPLLLENHLYIVALTSDLQRVSFCKIKEFLYYSSTTELILSPILYKGSYPSFKASPLYRKSSLALWLPWRVNSGEVATRISTSSRSD